MNTIFQNFEPSARTWIYQADRNLSAQEVQICTEYLKQFVASWQAHGNDLNAASVVLYNRFLVLMVDEAQAAATGCSIDKSVQLVKQIGAELHIDFFNRMQVCYLDTQNNLQHVLVKDIDTLFQNKALTGNTLIFNNMVSDKASFETQWKVALKDSWAANYLSERV